MNCLLDSEYRLIFGRHLLIILQLTGQHRLFNGFPVHFPRADDLDARITAMGDAIKIVFVTYAVVEHPVAVETDHTFDPVDAFEAV